MYACWTVKGGSGTTVFASALALMLAERNGKATIIELDRKSTRLNSSHRT